MSDTTPVEQIAGIVSKTRNYFDTGATKKYEWRVSQIKNIIRMVTEHKQTVCNCDIIVTQM
jgi:hypothetical protein